MFILLIRGVAGSKLGPKAVHLDRDLFVIFLSLFRKYGDSRPISIGAIDTSTLFPINFELLTCHPSCVVK